MVRRPISRRSAGRRRAREQARLAADRERLARAAPGGSARRPIDVESPTQVEAKAARMACPLCDGTVRVDEHVVRVVDEESYRVAVVTCARCGVTRDVFFRLRPDRLH